MGVAGAALATAISEVSAGALYCFLMVRRKLLRLSSLFKPPKLSALIPLLQGGSAMLLRQVALNVSFITSMRRVQEMDMTGVSPAAYAITTTVYNLGVVIM